MVPGVGETIVYNLGTLYGEWPDGTAFEGNRYVNRFVVKGGKIVQMDVWNDSAERLLMRAGIAAKRVHRFRRTRWPVLTVPPST